jgi:NADH:ubiquinone oxidoreductase subunit 5 (subunit L)/multisubunit Na+/H+ antiporter MnhA subunit
MIPLGSALLALTGALAAACFVKVFGVVFLGKWRGKQKPEQIHEVGRSMRGGMLLAAITCLLLHLCATRINRVPVWDCGFAKLTRRMQYTATAFSMPIRRVLGFLFAVREQIEIVPHTNHSAYPPVACSTVCGFVTVSGTGSTNRRVMWPTGSHGRLESSSRDASRFTCSIHS